MDANGNGFRLKDGAYAVIGGYCAFNLVLKDGIAFFDWRFVLFDVGSILISNIVIDNRKII